MEERPQARGELRFSQVIDGQLQAVESLLNTLAAHGLQVWRDEQGRWWWRWYDRSAPADGLGSVVLDAVYWYFGLAPDPEGSE